MTAPCNLPTHSRNSHVRLNSSTGSSWLSIPPSHCRTTRWNVPEGTHTSCIVVAPTVSPLRLRALRPPNPSNTLDKWRVPLLGFPSDNVLFSPRIAFCIPFTALRGLACLFCAFTSVLPAASCCHAKRRKVTRDDAAAIVFLLYAFRDVKKAAYCKTVWAGKKDMHFLIPFRVWGRAERRGRTLLLRGVGFLPFTLMLIRHMSIRWVYCFPLPTGPGRFFHSRGVHFCKVDTIFAYLKVTRGELERWRHFGLGCFRNFNVFVSHFCM